MKSILLTQGFVAWVDDDDYVRLSEHKWCVSRMGRRWYAIRWQPGADDTQKKVYMHREILNAKPGQEVDHVLGESSPGIVHNWRANLRLCSHVQNLQGFKRKKKGMSSRFRGVCWWEDRQKWTAQIQVKGRKRHLGVFESEENAARAYDVAAKRFFGEFASPNFS